MTDNEEGEPIDESINEENDNDENLKSTNEIQNYVVRKLSNFYSFNKELINLIKRNYKEIQSENFTEYFIINSNWMNNFLKFYDYNKISKVIKEEEKKGELNIEDLCNEIKGNSIYESQNDEIKDNLKNIDFEPSKDKIPKEVFLDEITGQQISFFNNFVILNKEIYDEIRRDDENLNYPNYIYEYQNTVNILLVDNIFLYKINENILGVGIFPEFKDYKVIPIFKIDFIIIINKDENYRNIKYNSKTEIKNLFKYEDLEGYLTKERGVNFQKQNIHKVLEMKDAKKKIGILYNLGDFKIEKYWERTEEALTKKKKQLEELEKKRKQENESKKKQMEEIKIKEKKQDEMLKNTLKEKYLNKENEKKDLNDLEEKIVTNIEINIDNKRKINEYIKKKKLFNPRDEKGTKKYCLNNNNQNNDKIEIKGKKKEEVEKQSLNEDKSGNIFRAKTSKYSIKKNLSNKTFKNFRRFFSNNIVELPIIDKSKLPEQKNKEIQNSLKNDLKNIVKSNKKNLILKRSENTAICDNFYPKRRATCDNFYPKKYIDKNPLKDQIFIRRKDYGEILPNNLKINTSSDLDSKCSENNSKLLVKKSEDSKQKSERSKKEERNESSEEEENESSEEEENESSEEEENESSEEEEEENESSEDSQSSNEESEDSKDISKEPKEESEDEKNNSKNDLEEFKEKSENIEKDEEYDDCPLDKILKKSTKKSIKDSIFADNDNLNNNINKFNKEMYILKRGKKDNDLGKNNKNNINQENNKNINYKNKNSKISPLKKKDDCTKKNKDKKKNKNKEENKKKILILPAIEKQIKKEKIEEKERKRNKIIEKRQEEKDKENKKKREKREKHAEKVRKRKKKKDHLKEQKKREILKIKEEIYIKMNEIRLNNNN